MILHRDDETGFGERPPEGGRVDRLDRVRVDHADRDAVPRELICGVQRLEERDACSDERRTVGVALAQCPAAADRERLAGVVQLRRLLARRAHVRDAGEIRHRLHQDGRRVAIGGVEHGRVVDGAHHREILERHL